MRNKLKKVMGTVMVFVLILGILAAPSQDAQAASQGHMKKLELRWDLKKGKEVVCDGLFPVVGKQDKSVTFEITKYKVNAAGKKGYKKLTLTCVNTLKYKPTKEEIHKILQSPFFERTGNFGGNGDSAVLDYNTGISLKRKNKFDVKVKCSDWKLVKSRICKDDDGCYMDMGDIKQTITIIYPEDYDGLCIGFLADNQLTKSKEDKMFWKGKTPFGKTSYYKKGKKNSHWMRVRASKKKKPAADSQPQETMVPTPTTSPSGDVSEGTSGNTPAAAAPTPTDSPSGDAPSQDPDVPTGIRTIVYDGTNSHEIKSVQERIAVQVKDGVTSIEDEAFYACSNLVSITIPNSVTSIGNGAFHGCSSLTDIVIPDGVTSIGYLAFYKCSNLRSITIPDSVASIGESAFQGCSSLTGIPIPAGLTQIENDMFMECSSLTSIMIPKGVTSIGEGVFYGCNSLTTIKVSEENEKYDSRNNCNAIIEKKTNSLIAGCKGTVIPDSVTSIGNSAFYGCDSLTGITIPDSVTSIGDTAFCVCSNLADIVIPNSVTSIGNDAFCGCDSLTGIMIPDSVTSIGSTIFFDCSSLTSIIWKGTTYTSVDDFENALEAANE